MLRSKTPDSPNAGRRQIQPTFPTIQKLRSMQRRTSIDLSHSEEVSLELNFKKTFEYFLQNAINFWIIHF